MKRNMTTILLFVVLFVGLALLLYPSVSDFYNSFHQSRAVATYNTVVEQESKKDYEADWAAANAYNEKLRAFLFLHLCRGTLLQYLPASMIFAVLDTYMLICI